MSQLRHVELADGCESIKTSTNYVLAGWMTGHRAGSRACSRLNFCDVFFSAKKIEPATRRWGSYEALSQLRGAEPATKHWASYVSLSQQGSFELWASKEAVSQQGSFELHHIYTYAVPTIKYTKSRAKHVFFEGDTLRVQGLNFFNLFENINKIDFSQTAECFGVFSHSKGFGADRSSSKTDSPKVPRFQVQVPTTGSQVKVPK